MNSPLAIMRSLWTRLLNRAGTLQKEVYSGSARRAINVSGVYVDESNALTLASVWCAVRAICEPLAAMPYHVYMSEGRKNTLVSGHPVDWLLSMQPNPEMTAFDFWDVMAQRMVMAGNALAEIERNNRGEPAWLWPLDAQRVQLKRNAAGGLQYEVTNQSREVTILDPMDVYHLHGLGDGLWGYSVIGMARESIGMGLAMEQFGSAFFGSGAHPGATIEAPVGMQLPKPAIDALIAEFDRRHSGAKNAFATTFLDKGMKVSYPTGVTAEDAQFLESRQFSILEIARWFRVPPHLLYDLSRATFSNIEHQSLEYVQHTLQPWAKRIEKQTDVKLFGRQQRGVFYSKFNFDSMLRGDITSRFTAYGQAKQNGWMSTNDIRFKEDMNPVKGGDEYLVQVNMTPSDLLREQAQANIDKTNAPPPAPLAAPAAEPDDNAPPTPKARAAAAVLALAERARS